MGEPVAGKGKGRAQSILILTTNERKRHVELTVLEQGEFAVIALKGNVMGGPDALQLNEQLHHFGDKGIKCVILDLSGVQVMNSSGLGMLIGGLTSMRNAGGDLKIVNASPKVDSLITVSKLTSVFPNYSSVEEAKKSFS
jgi:anti-sigma B factor antagonist